MWKKYILIDELENGLHYEGIEKLLNAILKTNNDVQFFITTHNLELLQKLSEILYREKMKKYQCLIYMRTKTNK
ncbi:AAA family ATPase [Campylobacter jejuni]